MLGLSNYKVGILGDGVIDQYLQVEFNRVSPENPIPVYLNQNDIIETYPGGAANVAYLLKPWNKNNYYIGPCNIEFKDVLEDFDIDYQFSKIKKIQIPKKIRLSDGKVPFCRIDHEKPIVYTLGISNFIHYEKFIDYKFDALIISDYNKGFLNDVEVVMKMKCLKVVDPKKGPLEKWKGCDIFKPNHKEAYELTGETDKEKQCRVIKRKTRCEHVVVTSGAGSIYGLNKKEYFEFETKQISKVQSVTGCGDLFVGVLTVAYLQGNSIVESAKMANNVCRQYVQKDQKPVYPCEISGKLIKPELLKDRDFTLAYQNGCFDLITPGHLHSFNFAKEKADKLVIGLNSDESVRRQNKNHPLINNQEYRIDMLMQLPMVDYICLFEEDTPLDSIKKIAPDCLIKGSEYTNPIGSELIKYYPVPMYKNYSSSELINRIKTS